MASGVQPGNGQEAATLPPMSSEELEVEGHRRSRLGVPAVGAGVVYLISGIVISNALSGAPTVGVLQGLEPFLEGTANPSVSPRAAEVRYISHRAFDLVAGGVLAAIAIAILTVCLLLLAKAARRRRPGASGTAYTLVLIGGTLTAVVGVAHEVVTAILTHQFAAGHDFSNHAVDHALTKGAANVITQYIDLLAGLTLAIGMVMTVLSAMRVGLIARWMAYLGMFSAILIFLPIGGAELEIIPSFWMVALGILFLGKLPSGEPPAWTAGEARPWPSPAEMRAQREAERGGKDSGSASGGGVPAPAPAPAPTPRSSNRRGRKRGQASRPPKAT